MASIAESFTNSRGRTSFVEGVPRLKRFLSRLPDTAKSEIREAIIAGAKEIESAAEANAPYRTGTLRGGIQSRISATNLYATVGVFRRAKAAPYARPIEFGFGARSLGATTGGSNRNRQTVYFTHTFTHGPKKGQTGRAYLAEDGTFRASRSKSKGRSIAPHRYLGRAAQGHGKAVIARIEKAIDSAIEKAGNG